MEIDKDVASPPAHDEWIEYGSCPPANYNPHTADAVSSGLGFSAMKLIVACVAFIVFVMLLGALWCIGIPTKSDL